MKRLLTDRTVGITELREPTKDFDKASGKPMAILKNNECVGYLVPADAVDENEPRPVDRAQMAREDGLGCEPPPWISAIPRSPCPAIERDCAFFSAETSPYVSGADASLNPLLEI